METYEEWMKEVDAVLMSRIGLCHRDLADRCWYDQYDACCTPEEAVNELLGHEPEEMMMNELLF